MVEKKDAHFSLTFLAIAALLVMLLVGIIFVRAVYHQPLALESNARSNARQVTFPQPQPGHFTAESLAKLREKENTDLHTYRWSNDARTEAQVPIDRAIELYEAHHAD